MFTESLAIAVFASLVWLALPMVGVQATGGAFLAMYVVYLPLLHGLARRRTGFAWVLPVKRQIVALLISALLICAISTTSSMLTAIIGLLISTVFALFALSRLSQMSGLAGAVAGVAGIGKTISMKIGSWRD